MEEVLELASIRPSAVSISVLVSLPISQMSTIKGDIDCIGYNFLYK